MDHLIGASWVIWGALDSSGLAQKRIIIWWT